MTSPRHERIAELFRQACRLTGTLRIEFLNASCEDPDERAEVELLLAADGDSLSPVDNPPEFRDIALQAFDSASDVDRLDRPAARPDDRADDHAPRQIGPYRILHKIGEGGMGAVFLAEQVEPIRRRVALKIIKVGMDTGAVVARFNNERQALALMDHPAVATVLDAGSTPQGRPYFVMEHVDGPPVTEFCDRHRLDIRQRLELFMRVCDGVQHAHHKTIIHRDLKPSNVLVATQDGRAAPKIIDFGVAKATTQTLAQQSLYTLAGQIIGTPAYMSPEQAAGGDDIDTRTDIYSLGIILYELLVGAMPIDRGLLRAADLGELQRTIREAEPLRPSTRVGRLADATTTVAGNRQTAPAALRRQLRGDLDWITMKALEKDRSRRYASAADLAEDIARHLRAEPVSAGPPSKVYRLGKLVRRNRGVFAAAALVLITLVAGLAGITEQYYEAVHARGEEEQQRRRAEKAREEEQQQRRLAEKSERLARQRAAELEQVTKFQQRMLAEMNARATGESILADLRERGAAALAKSGRDEEQVAAALAAFDEFIQEVNATSLALKLIEERILAPAAGVLEREYDEQPLTRAALRQSVAESYRDFGFNDKALPLLEAALTTRRRELGEDHPLTLETLNTLGLVQLAWGQRESAEKNLRQALESRRRVLGDDHPETLTSINNMGFFFNSGRRHELAEPFYREALDGRRRILDRDDPQVLSSLNNMGSLLMDMGKLDEAEPYFREALDGLRRVRGSDHPQTMTAINNLGMLLRMMGRLDEAEPCYREALDLRRRALGDEHPETLISLNNMGFLLKVRGRLNEAEVFYREALAIRRRVLGNEHAQTLTSLYNLGGLLFTTGRHAEAEPLYRESFETSLRVLGEQHPDTLDCRAALGALLRARGRLDEAETHLTQALEGMRAVFPAGHPRTLITLSRLGALLHDRGRLDEAEERHREAVEGLRKSAGPEHALTLDAVEALVELLSARERCDEAEPAARELLAARRRAAGDAHPDARRTSIMLARVLVRCGKAAEGEPLAGAAVEALRAVPDQDRLWLGVALGCQGFALARLGQLDAAESALLEGYGIVENAAGRDHPDAARLASELAGLYEARAAAESGGDHAAQAARWRALARTGE